MDESYWNGQSRRCVAVASADGGSEVGGRERHATEVEAFVGEVYPYQNIQRWILTSGTGGVGGASFRDTYLVNCTTTVGSFARRESVTYLTLLAGQTRRIVCSFSVTAHSYGSVSRVGYFDAFDGVFVEISGNTRLPSLVVLSSSSGATMESFRVNQINWNLDTLNGLGASGLAVNFATYVEMHIEIMSCGTIRIGFVVQNTNVLVWAHEFYSANAGQTVPLLASYSLPFAFEARCIGPNGSSTMATRLHRVTCTTMAGPNMFVGVPCAYSSFTSNPSYAGFSSIAWTNSGSQTALTVRLKSTLRTSGQRNRGYVIPLRVAVWRAYNAAQTQSLQLFVRLNITALGGAPVFVDCANGSEMMEVSRTQFTAATAGVILGTVTLPAFDATDLCHYPVVMDFPRTNVMGYQHAAGFGDALTTNSKSTSGVTATGVHCLLEWLEVY